MTDAKVWVVSELYYPEDTSTGYFLTGIAEGLAAEFVTRVICSQPTYSARGRRAAQQEWHGGVEIFRCRNTRLNPHVLWSRIANVVTISIAMFVDVCWRVHRGDVVIVVTNPPTLPFVVQIAARLRGARAVLLVHDVYPDVLGAVGLLRHGSVAYRVVDAAHRWLYRRFDRVVVLGRDMARVVSGKIGSEKRVTVITNWGDIDGVRPTEGGTSMRTALGLSGKFIVQCGGNMGRTHGLSTIIEAAHILRSDPGIHILFVGWGVRRAEVERTIRGQGLENVTAHPAVLRNELGTSLNTANVTVISLIDGMSGLSVPSRLYNVLAAGQPVLAIANDDSELAAVVRENEAGWVITPGDAAGLVRAIEEARDNTALLAKMARNARVAAEKYYTRERVIQDWRAMIRGLICGGDRLL